MKHLFAILLLLCASLSASAQTITLTNTAAELVTAGAASRTFYDLDAVTFSYKAGHIEMKEVSTGTLLFSGDTTEVTIAGLTTWASKVAKMVVWYQDASTTNGYRYFLPRRGVAFRYQTSKNLVQVYTPGSTKNVLLETSLDSIKITGVSGASNKLAFLRTKIFLGKSRQNQDIGESATIVVGPAAGSGGTATIVSQGSTGRITITPGSSTTTSAVLCTVTLPVTYPNGTFILFSDGAANSNPIFAVGSAGSFTLNSKGTAITASGSPHIYTYQVIGF